MTGLRGERCGLPVLIFGLSLLLCSLLLNFVLKEYLFYIVGALLSLFCISKFYLNNQSFSICFLSCLIASCMFTYNTYKNDKFFESIENKNLSVVGYIVESPEYNEDFITYKVKIIEIVGYKRIPKFKMKLTSTRDLGIDNFEIFKCDIHSLSYKDITYDILQLHSKGIYLSGFINIYQGIEQLGKVKNVWYYASILKRKIHNYITKTFDTDCASLIQSLILGEKQELSRDIRDSFYNSGLAHFLAVSGFHFSMLTKILYDFLKLLRVKSKYSNIVCIIFIILYAIIVGLTPSVVRASIMLIIQFLSRLLFKTYNSLNSIGLSLSIILLINQESCLDIGLWLSFMSTLSIILFNKKIYNYISSKIIFFKKNVIARYLVSIFSSPISSMIFNFPVLCMRFKYLYTFFLLSNLVVVLQIFVFFILVILSFISNKFHFIHNFSNLISKSIIISLEKLSNIPFSKIILDYLFVKLSVSCIIIVIIFCLLFRNIEQDLIKILLIFSIFIMSGVISYEIYSFGSIKLSLFHEGYICVSNGKENIILCKDINKLDDKIKNKSYIVNFDESVLVDKEKKYKISAYSSKVVITVITIRGYSWIKIEILNKTVLICLSGGDLRDLPENFRNCDLFIMFKIPNVFDLVNCHQKLYFDNSYRFKNNLCKLIGKNCLISNKNDVDIYFKNYDYVIKRKN